MTDIARPGSKAVARKNHEAGFFFWAGRATKMRNAECEMRNGIKKQ